MVPTHQEAKKGGKNKPKHPEIHPRARTATVPVVKDVHEAGWVLLQNEQTDLFQCSAHGTNAFGQRLREKEKKGDKRPACNKDGFHTPRLHYSARTSPTKVATMAPTPTKKPIK